MALDKNEMGSVEIKILFWYLSKQLLAVYKRKHSIVEAEQLCIISSNLACQVSKGLEEYTSPAPFLLERFFIPE